MRFSWQQPARFLAGLAVDLLMPQECLGCGLGGTWLCHLCQGKLVLRQDFPCSLCQRPAWQGETHPACRSKALLSGLLVAAYHSQLLKDLVHNFKYGNLRQLVRPLGALLLGKLNQSPLAQAMLMNPATMLVPMPLHAHKAWDRGYNQSQLLAERLAENYPASLCCDIMRRLRNTSTQTDLPKNKRWQNVQGAFAVNHGISLKGKTVVLVDDILTTGATISAAAQVLKKVGASEVWAVVLARG